MTAYGYVGTYATPLHPYLPPGAMGSSGGCSQGPEYNQVFVLCSTCHLELQPASTDAVGRAPSNITSKRSGNVKRGTAVTMLNFIDDGSHPIRRHQWQRSVGRSYGWQHLEYVWSWRAEYLAPEESRELLSTQAFSRVRLSGIWITPPSTPNSPRQQQHAEHTRAVTKHKKPVPPIH